MQCTTEWHFPMAIFLHNLYMSLENVIVLLLSLLAFFINNLCYENQWRMK